ncbi:MAG: DUF1800 family protein [Pseudomonadota bacterium]
MQQPTPRSLFYLTILSVASVLALSACSGSGGSEPSNGAVAAPPPSPPPPLPPPPTGTGAFKDAAGTSRFLTQATFGPTAEDVAALTGTSASAWFLAETQKTPSLNVPLLQAIRSQQSEESGGFLAGQSTTFSFWRNAIEGDDQLRQRMAFALSQLLVVSNFGGEVLTDVPEAVAYYQDVLTRNAFGNYRDLLEEVTYSPAMGHFLTYMGNQKADPATGRMPDENYAREILQLFTIGVVELSPNGEHVLGADGQPIELYDNMDITGLAKVFTGLNINGAFEEPQDFPQNWLVPMVIVEEQHSGEPKHFLNCSIAAGTPAAQSLDEALDCIMAHPNVAPFISRQLIQRFTTSDPDPDYVQRVAATFDSGRFSLPDGTSLGDGRKGDLKATLAAVLFDEDARGETALSDPQFGKIREPILRFTHWARAFDADASFPEYGLELYDLSDPSSLSQHPYRARSVFNFYRPGHIAPGTGSGAIGMTVPELQLVNASSTPGYMNFISFWAFGGQSQIPYEELAAELEDIGLSVQRDRLESAFVPDYTDELALANNAGALVDHLDTLLTYSSLSDDTKSAITATLERAPIDGPADTEGLNVRVGTAVLLVMSSPDYLVQR